MCAAASTPWPSSRRRSTGLPVLGGDDDRDGVGFEPTVRAEFSFGQVTLPVPPRSTPVPPAVARDGIVKPYPRTPSPTPYRAAAALDATMPAPLSAPPPSATRALVIGFSIGTTLGLAILGAAWHFFL